MICPRRVGTHNRFAHYLTFAILTPCYSFSLYTLSTPILSFRPRLAHVLTNGGSDPLATLSLFNEWQSALSQVHA